MFVIILFAITKKWKQLKCPVTEKWIRKLWFMHTIEFYSSKYNFSPLRILYTVPVL